MTSLRDSEEYKMSMALWNDYKQGKISYSEFEEKINKLISKEERTPDEKLVDRAKDLFGGKEI